jgi:hypothetical protein
MPKIYMCQYGNCQEEKIKVIVTDKFDGTVCRFCCQLHAAAYLLEWAQRREFGENGFGMAVVEPIQALADKRKQ